MKHPIKPFLVEVKRSRSIPSPSDTVRSKRPIFVDDIPASRASEALQVAERAFRLASPRSIEKAQAVETAAGRILPSLEPDVVPQTAVAGEQAAEPSTVVEKPIAPRTRKPRRMPVSRGEFVTVATEPADDRAEEFVLGGKPDVPAPAVMPFAVQDEQPLPAAPEAAPEAGVDDPADEAGQPAEFLRPARQWSSGARASAPGEKWKRRLRYLRAN